jgi:hypothetical protein
MYVTEDPRRQNSGNVWIGVGLAFLLVPLTLVIPPGIILIGVTEWIYLLPLVFWFKKKGRTGIVQGLLIGGGVLALLNAACFGILFGSGLSSF